MLDKGRILYEECGGRERKVYRLPEEIRIKKGAQIGKAEDLSENRLAFLKLVQLEGPDLRRIRDQDVEDSVRNYEREGRFQFFYPFIEQVYGTKLVYAKHKDGSRTYYFGVSVEYVEGEDVSDFRKRLGDRSLTSGEETGIFRNILQFLYGMRYYLNYASLRYLHRDLKPENVMIDGNGNVKIIDFDFAHISGSRETENGRNSLPFSRGYSSPLLFKGGSLKLPDVQDEFYAAGRLLFYWLNGAAYFTEEESTEPESTEPDEKPLRQEIPYIKDPALGFGTKTERFRKEYQTPEYEAFRKMLDRMCGAPSEKRYDSIEEIIEDYIRFLRSKYGKTEAELEALMEIENMPVLGNNLTRFEEKAPIVCSKVNGRKSGKKLYRYSMRDITADGRVAMTIYNLGGEVYYIPAGETRRRTGRENEDFRVRNQDVFVTENGTEITFTL